MSSKRLAAKEWKRKRNRQKLIFRMSVIGVCILALIGVGYIAWDMHSRTYVMVFEGQRIPTSDMHYFTLLDIVEERHRPASDRADHLAYFLVLNQRAQQHNLSLTYEDWHIAAANVEQMRQWGEVFGISLADISDARLHELSSMHMLINMLTELYTPDFEINEEDFLNALGSHMFFERAEFVEMDFRFHISLHLDEAESVRTELVAADPADIDDVLLRAMREAGMMLEGEIEDVERITMADMRMMGLDQFVLMELANLQEGDISEPLEMDGVYVIFIVDSKFEPTPEVVESNFRERFTWEQRTEIFVDLLETWREEADIRMNPRGINAA